MDNKILEILLDMQKNKRYEIRNERYEIRNERYKY